MVTNVQVLMAYEAIAMLDTTRLDGLLAVQVGMLHDALQPIARTIERGMAVIQKEHQTRIGDVYQFDARGNPLFNDPFAYRAAREAAEDAPVAVKLPVVTPLVMAAFPDKAVPWTSRYVRALAAIGWLILPEPKPVDAK